MAELLIDSKAGPVADHFALAPEGRIIIQNAQLAEAPQFQRGAGHIHLTDVNAGDDILVELEHPAFKVTFRLEVRLDAGTLVVSLQGLQPRVKLMTQAASPPNAHVAIALDLPFLDVSQAIGWGTPSLHGVQLRIYEHLGAPRGMPRVWCIAVPPAAQGTRDHHNVLVFVRPEMDAFHSAQDPGFATKRLGGTFTIYMADPPSLAMPQFDASKLRSWPPLRGWASALAASSQPVVMAYVLPPPAPANLPIPEGDNVPMITWPSDSSAFRVRDFSTALVAALGDDGLISSGARTLRRLGLSFFSQSADFGFNLTRTHRNEIDEVIVFDPNTPTFGTVSDWWKGNRDRRLHLIGGVFHTDMLALAKTLDDPTRFAITMLPATIQHWQDAPEYKAAFGITSSDDELADGTTTTRYSTDTGITFSHGFVVWRSSQFFGAGATRTELGGMLVLRNGARAPSGTAEFKKFFDQATIREGAAEFGPRFRSLRHQWSVAGGLRDGSGNFQRFLQLALAAGAWQ